MSGREGLPGTCRTAVRTGHERERSGFPSGRVASSTGKPIARGRCGAAIGKVVRTREIATKTSIETAYYLLSAALSPERLNEVVRSHWSVENGLHGRLDVVMNEDKDGTRLGNARENLAILRHMALNVMQKDATKGSLRGKFKRAGWDEVYLAKLIASF
jgi:predicted transposase YbfD/YdcC